MTVPFIFSQFPHVLCGCTTKQTSQTDIPSDLAFCKQIHSSTVLYAHGAGLLGDGDGIWTAVRGVFCAVRTADCLPIAFVYDDQDRPLVAMLHGGWRGLQGGIIASLLTQWQSICTFFDSTKIYVFVGPSIGSCCYQFGPEAPSLFPSSIFTHTNGQYVVDLKAYASLLCIAQGIPTSHIQVSGACTSCQHDIFWSYRQGDKDGRMLTWIGMIA